MREWSIISINDNPNDPHSHPFPAKNHFAKRWNFHRVLLPKPSPRAMGLQTTQMASRCREFTSNFVRDEWKFYHSFSPDMGIVFNDVTNKLTWMLPSKLEFFQHFLTNLNSPTFHHPKGVSTWSKPSKIGAMSTIGCPEHWPVNQNINRCDNS